MRTIGIYLIYASVVLRALVVLAGEKETGLALTFLILYGLLLLAEPWIMQHKPWLPGAYLLVQSGLVVWLLVLSRGEDFFALLFIPLSLTAILLFGRRFGFLCIMGFILAMAGPLMLTSEEGPLFGLVMTSLMGGLCLLFGSYALQVQKAELTHQQNQTMLGELQIAHRQLQGYAAQKEDLAAEHERTRLARELHDSVTQTVFSMNLSVQTTRLLLEKEPDRAASQLERVEDLASSALREIQTLVTQLQPKPAVDQGLPAALQRLAAERRVRDGLEVNLEINARRALPEPVATGLFSITQEALNNVVKHSGVLQATIRLNTSEEPAFLEIEDGGVGFDPQTALRARDHLGLAGMTERASELGWIISIESSPGRGTCIRIAENTKGGMA